MRKKVFFFSPPEPFVQVAQITGFSNDDKKRAADGNEKRIFKKEGLATNRLATSLLFP